MFTEDDFNYALENTRVVLAPQGKIDTFGSTSFRFYLITELMDQVNQVRIRDGNVQAERPQLITPEHYSQLALDGFGEQAQEFAEWLQEHSERFTFLKYGFQFRKTNVMEEIVHDTVDAVVDRLASQVERSGETLSAVIHGVDDAWEVCLMKFTVDMIQKSAGGNLGDFRRRGLL